ncbi:alpha-ketoglutarate-dependent dioxygenase AlkB [Variovorax sp. efr-133-TYG-130]|uniref:alpha-ketoglutarate-dependent dioxygenase AlkB n=1 Tax=Variovorax sp. efr-133-TYG-130 TaxID=3040327 RepID=UPI0025570A6C|nr:alpha-ketoglutarate-dependent dioxygenase AlkB [Variovorax sp. efr-133-TYG-130]
MSSPPSAQLDLLAAASSTSQPVTKIRLFGVALDEERVMEFLACEWLMAGSDGRLLLGIEAPCDSAALSKGHQVAVWFDQSKLPLQKVMVWGAGAWAEHPLEEIDPNAEAISWEGPLPLFAVSHFVFQSEDARANLISLVRGFVDMEVPSQPMSVGAFHVQAAPPVAIETAGTRNVPSNWNALRGAAALAIWAVPAIGPWMALLCDVLSGRAPVASAAAVDALWWRTPPWAFKADDSQFQSPLWGAMLHELSGPRVAKEWRPKSILQGICDLAERLGEDGSRIKRLLDSTSAVLEDRATIKDVGLVDDPLALSLQLLLLRPSPEKFMRWPEEWPAIPPAAWWTGLTLSGYVNGYNSLPVEWKGSLATRKLIALRTWVLASEADAGPWSQMTKGPLEWVIDEKGFRILDDGKVWVEHKIGSRGRWYQADLGDEAVREAAQSLAEEFCPELSQSHLVLNAGEYDLLGEGTAELDPKHRVLKVSGAIEFRAAGNIRVESRLDVVKFKHWLATASIAQRLQRPPNETKPLVRPLGDPGSLESQVDGVEPFKPVLPLESIETEKVASTPKKTKARAPKIAHVASERPKGLGVVPEFINEREEHELLAAIDAAQWDTSMRRRVQHYGWKYDYKTRKVSPSARIGPLPAWAQQLAHRLVEKGVVSEEPDQVIVNEYQGKQGIAKHVDCIECFRGPIVTISLNETWEMLFTRTSSDRKLERYGQLLPRRSAVVLDGEARTSWQHEIPPRLEEMGVVRGRRISITLRRVNRE